MTRKIVVTLLGRSAIIGMTVVACLAPLWCQSFDGVLTWHNDNTRTGQNLNEVTLTPGTVNSAQFGKVFSYTVDGQIYAQPLVVTKIDIEGHGRRNVVYVATMRNIYALNADRVEDAPLWKVYLGTPMRYNQVPLGFGVLVGLYNIRPFIGVTSMPAIDADTRRLYAVAKIAESNQPSFIAFT